MGVVAVGAVTLEVPPITMRGAVGTCRGAGGPAFFDPIAWDSSDFAPGRARDINQRALNNLIKQGVRVLYLARCGDWACGAGVEGLCGIGLEIYGGTLMFLVWVSPRSDAAGFWVCGKLLSDGDGVVMGCSGAVFPLSFGLVI